MAKWASVCAQAFPYDSEKISKSICHGIKKQNIWIVKDQRCKIIALSSGRSAQNPMSLRPTARISKSNMPCILTKLLDINVLGA
jgi:hypothetical protein